MPADTIDRKSRRETPLLSSGPGDGQSHGVLVKSGKHAGISGEFHACVTLDERLAKSAFVPRGLFSDLPANGGVLVARGRHLQTE